MQYREATSPPEEPERCSTYLFSGGEDPEGQCLLNEGHQSHQLHQTGYHGNVETAWVNFFRYDKHQGFYAIPVDALEKLLAGVYDADNQVEVRAYVIDFRNALRKEDFLHD